MARSAGLRPGAIAEFEGGAAPPAGPIADALARALQTAGVLLLEADGGGPGVRLRRQGPPDEGLRPEELNSENDL